MYSSLDNPTYSEWVVESDNLLKELTNHLRLYTLKLNKAKKENDSFMIRFYCLKLLDANRRLKMENVSID